MPSLVLFVNGFPTSFSVTRTEDCYLLVPKEDPYNSIPPKKIEIRNEAGKWIVKGTDDQSLIDQVMEDISFIQSSFEQ